MSDAFESMERPSSISGISKIMGLMPFPSFFELTFTKVISKQSVPIIRLGPPPFACRNGFILIYLCKVQYNTKSDSDNFPELSCIVYFKEVFRFRDKNWGKRANLSVKCCYKQTLQKATDKTNINRSPCANFQLMCQPSSSIWDNSRVILPNIDKIT